MTQDSVDSVDDGAIVARLRTGDATAARLLHARHAAHVHRVAWRILRDDAAAADIAQETFIRAFGSLSLLRDGATVRAWLSVIALRLAYDALRRARRTSRRELPLETAADIAAECAVGEPVLRERIREAIAALPEKRRSVLVMFELHGFSHQEIASVLGIPVATSKTRLFQARASLRQTLASLRSEISS